jgi:hypothetical protein
MKRAEKYSIGMCMKCLVLYARIIPSDFDLYVPQDNTPQVWKFIIINNQVLLYAERCTNAHDFLPIVFGQPLEDGLDFQTKSFAQNVLPFQDLASAAMNASIASKRKLVMDRMFYDPSRIREADINSDNPSAKIPVRPAAYGKPISEAVYPVPYRDELSASVVQKLSYTLDSQIAQMDKTMSPKDSSKKETKPDTNSQM